MTEETFRVRIGHIAPDAPAVDFFVDGYPVLTNREYGDIPAYTEHLADEYNVSVRITNSGKTILEDSIRFNSGAFHTLLFVGTGDDYEFWLLTDGESMKE